MALPYIDKDYEVEGAKELVEKLLQEELGSSKPKPLVKDIDPSATDAGNSFLEGELIRVGTGQTTEGLDSSRFRLEPPSGKSAQDVEAWHKAALNAHAQLEHQQNRLLTLELIKKFGSNAWRLHNFELEYAVNHLRELVRLQKLEQSNLNKERKSEQIRVGMTLSTLESKWAELVDQSLRVDIACQYLEHEIDSLRDEQENL